MNLLQRLSNKPRADIRQLDFDDWLHSFDFNGNGYPMSMVNQTMTGGKTQEVRPNFNGLANGAMRQNGIVWACVTARMMLTSELTYQFRRLGSITSGDLYGTTALQALEEPWPGGTTRKLNSIMDLHAQLAGNGYAYRDPNTVNTIRVMRPDWVTIVLGSRNGRPDFRVGDVDTEVIGYIYRPHGAAGDQAVSLLREEVAHYMPIPDPEFPFRGMSWLQPVVREIMSDTGMTEHKLRFLENGATANMVVTLDPRVNQTEFDSWVDRFEEGHRGVLNAYKTIYLAGGADAKVVGSNLQQLDFRAVQAHGETRICNAAGIPPIIVGVSEGLDSATYSNYAQARRAWGDSSLRPLWAGLATELGQLVQVPGGSELWYDERRIAFLQEDLKDQAETMQMQALTLQTLITAGWVPESAASFVETGDLSKLIHTGLVSVQLIPPGATLPSSTSSTSPEAPPNAKAMIACSLCKQHAASNPERCPKCYELATLIQTTPNRIVAQVSEQLDMSATDVKVAFGLEKPELEPLKLSGKPKDFLTPVVVRNGRLK